MLIIKLPLALAAIYCGGMWLWLVGVSLKHRSADAPEYHETIERYTFHLGLCFILATGFLGLME